MIAQKSYSQILKASSIMGGAAAIVMLLGMVRIKFAAILIGPTGVGLNATFSATQNLIGTLAGLGLQSSAVRDIAAAVSKADQQEIGRKVLALRRICWLTGIVGMLTVMLLSPMISQITFGHQNYALDIAALGLIILITNILVGQVALIQGMRRISNMALANIGGAVLATPAAIGFYYWLGLRGIVPSLVGIAIIQLAITWYFARRIPVPPVRLTWAQTFREANDMVKLGLVLMWSALMVNGVSYFTIILVTRKMGLDAVGLYTAAFTLSSISVNFVLGAMGADYYPRLVGVSHDKEAINRLVNEQTEVGILLALPGLLVTLALAPWILQIFYTHEFVGAAELLQWFVLGCLGRVISWPLGLVMLALGKVRWFLFTETNFNLAHLLLIAVGLKWLGIEGIAIAFFVLYIFYIVMVYFVVRYLTEFSWTNNSLRMFIYFFAACSIAFAASRLLPILWASLVGLIITTAASFFCLRELVRLVGPEHRIVRMITAIPGARSFLISRL